MRRAGKGSGGDLISQRRKLSSDARLIIALLKKQPQKIDELCKRAVVHVSTFYRIRPLLERKGIMKEIEDGYVLWTYKEIEKAVVDAVNEWRSLAFRYPTVEETANEIGIVPEEAKILIYRTSDKTGWFVPNEGIIESAREKLGEVLVCGARIRDIGLSKLQENYSYDEDVEIMKEAEHFLEEHPEMLPKLTEGAEEVASWPSEALKYLVKGYKPKDRTQPYVAVIRS